LSVTANGPSDALLPWVEHEGVMRLETIAQEVPARVPRGVGGRPHTVEVVVMASSSWTGHTIRCCGVLMDTGRGEGLRRCSADCQVAVRRWLSRRDRVENELRAQLHRERTMLQWCAVACVKTRGAGGLRRWSLVRLVKAAVVRALNP